MFLYSGGELPYPAGGELPYRGGDPYPGVSGADVFRTEPPLLSPETTEISTCRLYLCFLYFFIFKSKKFFFLLELVEFTLSVVKECNYRSQINSILTKFIVNSINIFIFNLL